MTNLIFIKMEISKNAKMGAICLNAAGVISTSGFDAQQRPIYSKSDFIIKLIAKADVNGVGKLPQHLDEFMNCPKDSAIWARDFLQKLQDEGMILYKTDKNGNPYEYVLTF